MVINRSLSEKLFGNYWKDRSDVTSVDWMKVWHVINHLLSHFLLQSSRSNTFRFRRRTFAGFFLVLQSKPYQKTKLYCSCRKLRQAFSASSHVFKKGKRNYSMKCLDFQLVNYFRFQQLDVHDVRTRRHKRVRFSLQLPTGWTWTKYQLFLYMVFQKTEVPSSFYREERSLTRVFSND